MASDRYLFVIAIAIMLVTSNFMSITPTSFFQIDSSSNKQNITSSTEKSSPVFRKSHRSVIGEEFEIFERKGNLGHLRIPKYAYRNIRQQRKWTFMVYLDGDNNLEGAGIDDFLEMSSVGSTSNVSIVVLFDRNSGYDTRYDDWTDTKFFNITTGLEPYASNAVNSTWGERNMGDPQTIVDFVSYSVQNYPAEHYALILWDHGGGLSGVCWDDSDGDDNINLHELRNALETIYNDLGIKIDLLGFDACLVGMIEIAYQVRDYVDYVVFSQEYEPGDGWPYDDILSLLVSNPTMQPYELAKIIAEKYVDSYNNGSQGYDAAVTQSAINISALVTITFRKLDRLMGEIIRNYNKYSASINYASSNAETFYYSNEKDIIHFLQLLKKNVTDQYLMSLIEETIDAINTSILYAGHLSGHPNAHGLSVNIPSSYVSSYDTILMSIDHQWDEFISKKTGNSVDIWFYDVVCLCSDGDDNGYYESGFIYVDLDSESSLDVYVEVYGYNGTDEILIGNSSIKTINNASSDDTIIIKMQMPTYSGIYSLRFEVYNTSGSLIDSLYYYSDDDVCDLPLEYKPDYPEIIVINPLPSTRIMREVLLQVNATDDNGIFWVKVKLGDVWYDMTYNATSGLWEYLWDTRNSSEGSYTIMINASDGVNVSSIRPEYYIDNINVTIVYPSQESILRGTIIIKADFESVEGIESTSAFAFFKNDTYQTSQISLSYNATSGYYEGTYNTSLISDDAYNLIVNISTNRSTFDIDRIEVTVDNIIEPILVVDDDGGADYEQYYISSLEDLGYILGKDFVVWSVVDDGPIVYDVLYNRTVVIWFTGDDYSSTLTASDISALEQYLDNNGSLFISGQDIGYDINDTYYDFYMQYLRAIYVEDDAGISSVFGVGDPFVGATYYLSGGDGANNNNYPSVIEPRTDLGAWAILNYSYNMTAAIAYNGSYKLIYFAFPFEAINNANDRQICMCTILNFLLGGQRNVDVKIVYPASGSNISGLVVIKANATSDSGYIVSVKIKIGDIINWTSMIYDPFERLWKYYWDTSNYPDDTYTVIVKATDNNSYVDFDYISVKTDNYDEWILLVDDDDGATYEDYYISALENISLEKGKNFSVWTVVTMGSPTYSVLSEYSIVIWFTGDDSSSTLTASDISALEQYLDNNGSLFISGQDIGYDINDTYYDFYMQYLRAIYVEDDAGISSVFGVGDPFVGATYYLSGGDGANNNNYPSVIEPRTDLGAWAILNYSYNMTAAIAYNGSYKLIYFAFPFEAINNATQRADCMNIIISWFLPGEANITVDIIEPSDGSILNTSLVYVEWNASPISEVDHFEIYLDGDLVNDSIPSSQLNYTLNISGDGYHQIEVVAVDAYGATSKDSVTVLIDTTPPLIAILSPPNNSNISDSYVVVRWWGYDSNGIDHYEVNLNGTGWIDVGLNTSYNFTGLSEGRYTVYVRAIDVANNSKIDSVMFTVDQTSPFVLIISPANNSEVNSTFTVYWVAYDNETGIFLLELKLDGEIVARFYYWNMSNNYTLHNVSNGEHYLELAGYDYAGNVNESFIIVTVVAPVIVLITEPTDHSYVNYTTIKVKWLIIYAENQLDHTEIYLDGNLVDTVSPSQLSYVLENVSEGSHRIEIVVVDIYGEYGIDYVDIIVDVTAPTVIIVAPSYEGYIYNVTNVTVSWLSYDSGGIEHFEVRLDDADWIYVYLNTSYTFVNVTEGNHTVYIKAVDLASNIEIVSRWFYVDVSPPQIVITAPSNGTGVYVNFTVWWEAWDNGTYIDEIELYLNGTLLVRFIYGENMTDHYDFINAEVGTYNITIVVYDAKGDSSFDTIIVFVVSVNVEISEPVDGQIINTTWIILNWSYIGSPDGFIICVNGTEIAALEPNTTTYNLSNIPEGYIVVEVVAIKDSAQVSDSVSIIVDLSPPEFSYISITNTTYINTTSIEIFWMAEDNISGIAIYYLYVDGSLINTTTLNNYTMELSEGRHIVSIVAEDNAGNRGKISIMVVVDMSAPIVEFSVLNATYHADSWYVNKENITIHLNISDLSYENATIVIYNDTWSHQYMTQGLYLSVVLSPGEYMINITVYDKFGNKGENRGRIIVDIEPPIATIISPEDNMVIVGNTVNVSWTAEDNYGILHCYIRLDNGTWIDVTNQTSYIFSDLSIGEHEIHLLVIDLAGNNVTVAVMFVIKAPTPGYLPYLIFGIILVAIIAAIVVILKMRSKKTYGEIEIAEEI